MTTHLDIEKERASDEFNLALIKHLGPEALAGDKLSPLEIFERGWLAARSASLPPMRGTDSQQDADRAAVIRALSTHRMVQMFEVEDDGSLGNSYPLIDRLCLEDGRDIASGKAEIEAIVDAVLDALDEQLSASGFREGRNTQPKTADRASLQADEGKDGEDAALWRKWLPYLKRLNKVPFNLAKDLAAIAAKEGK
jgi:hypothetical protein